MAAFFSPVLRFVYTLYLEPTRTDTEALSK